MVGIFSVQRWGDVDICVSAHAGGGGYFGVSLRLGLIITGCQGEPAVGIYCVRQRRMWISIRRFDAGVTIFGCSDTPGGEGILVLG